jgi:hypothetical protein
MPRRKRLEGGTAFERVQQQARALLSSLQNEIRGKEVELRRLKEEVATLGRLSGSSRSVEPAAPVRRAGGRPRGRLDWSTILEGVPKQFKAADIRRTAAVRSKRPSEIFAAITRWIEAGTVRRKERGVYERV